MNRCVLTLSRVAEKKCFEFIYHKNSHLQEFTKPPRGGSAIYLLPDLADSQMVCHMERWGVDQ